MARTRHILETRLTYIDHPSFHDPSARDEILAPFAQSVDEWVSRRWQPADRLSPASAGRSGPMFLSRDQEAHLFRKMNYLKFRASQLRDQLDPARPSLADLDEIERLQSEAMAVKNRFVEMNQGLVVFIARARLRAGQDLSERLSDGNLALIQAVDGFDFARGNKFSTYATWAIRNALARSVQRSIRRRYPLALCEESLTVPDSGTDEHEREEDRERCRSAVRRWLGRLDQRERRILASRYGIGGGPKHTLREIGRELGISKERVRQIEERAQAKLLKMARLEAVEPSEI